MMPPQHELGLLLINTIRKVRLPFNLSSLSWWEEQDLSSANVLEIMLALGMIVKIPSVDLSPAVTPILIAKGLLRHKMCGGLWWDAMKLSDLRPAVRQRALQSLAALHLDGGEGSRSFPISMNKLVKLVSGEEDVAVLAGLLRTIRQVLHVSHV